MILQHIDQCYVYMNSARDKSTEDTKDGWVELSGLMILLYCTWYYTYANNT